MLSWKTPQSYLWSTPLNISETFTWMYHWAANDFLGAAVSEIIFIFHLMNRITVSFSKQKMSKDKYPSIFSRQMEAIVFLILQIFSCGFENCALIITRICSIFSRCIFSHETRLDQSRASENVWLIMRNSSYRLWWIFS